MPQRRRGIFSSGLARCTCAGVILELREKARVSHKMTSVSSGEMPAADANRSASPKEME